MTDPFKALKEKNAKEFDESVELGCKHQGDLCFACNKEPIKCIGRSHLIPSKFFSVGFCQNCFDKGYEPYDLTIETVAKGDKLFKDWGPNEHLLKFWGKTLKEFKEDVKAVRNKL